MKIVYLYKNKTIQKIKVKNKLMLIDIIRKEFTEKTNRVYKKVVMNTIENQVKKFFVDEIISIGEYDYYIEKD